MTDTTYTLEQIETAIRKAIASPYVTSSATQAVKIHEKIVAELTKPKQVLREGQVVAIESEKYPHPAVVIAGGQGYRNIEDLLSDKDIILRPLTLREAGIDHFVPRNAAVALREAVEEAIPRMGSKPGWQNLKSALAQFDKQLQEARDE